jgi:hypothetical protein
MKIVATNFKPLPKNTLRGFIDLALPEVGIVLEGTAWHEKNGKQWLSPAGCSYADKATGEIRWVNVVDFTALEAKEAFQRAGLAAVHKLANGGDRVSPFI